MKKRTFILTMLTVFALTMTGCQAAPQKNAARIQKQTTAAAQMDADAPVTASSPDTKKASSGLAEASSDTQKTASGLTGEDAKEIALADAGLTEESTSHIRVKKDYDDSITVYDVEFYAENKEYDYEIDAATGEIRSFDFDIEHDFYRQSDASGAGALLNEQEAAEIALAKVEGASMQDLYITLDRDDGQDIYEGEIRYNGMEYEFEINAGTGDILEWSQEREDD